jgi:hypothetical protein
MLVGFFAAHGGMFIAIHLLFLCLLFSGDWFRRVGGVGDFLYTFFIASGAWAPLLFAAIAGAIDVLTGEFHPPFVDALGRRLHVALAPRADPAAIGDPLGGIVGGLYLRVFVMQAAIIFGAMASVKYGTTAPLVIVIVLKTLIDLSYRLSAVSGEAPAASLSGVQFEYESNGKHYKAGGTDRQAPPRRDRGAKRP